MINHHKSEGYFKSFHSSLFLATLLIVAIGLLNLNSATMIFPEQKVSSLFWSQCIYMALGLIVMFVVSFLKIEYLYKLSFWAYFLAIVSLVLVLVIGSEFKGSQSWIDLGIVRLQPSEFAKLGFIMFLSSYFANQSSDSALSLKDLIWPLLIFALPVGLIVWQGDLGTSLFFGFIFISLVLIQGIKWRLFLITLGTIVALCLLAYFFFLKPYQQKRIISFLNPEHDAKGSGYHLVQSKIAVGSGKLFGRGYLKGESHRLKYLPEKHTDFVFPVLAQEWGFVGAVSTLVLYFCFLMLGIRVCEGAMDPFAFYLSLGLVSLFFWHLVINLGGVLGLIPLTGVPLPLFSYGGSSLITTWTAIGMLLAIHRDRFATNPSHQHLKGL